MTVSKWVGVCAKSESDKQHLKHLESFFGESTIAEIDDDRVKEYRLHRTTQKIIKHGKPSKKTVSQTTINKEVSTLRKFLRLARKKGFVDKVTKFTMAPERPRKRVLTDHEYQVLIGKSPGWLRRACIMA